MFTLLMLTASESAHGEGGISPYAVGGIALGILLVSLLILLAIGGGREHS